MKNPFLEDFKNQLKNYKNIENSIIKIQDEIEVLKSILDPKGFSSESFNCGGSDYNTTEDKMYNYLAKSVALEKQLKINKFTYSTITKSFEILEKNEKIVIEEFYFKNTNIVKLSDMLHYEERQVYRIINTAIYKMLCFQYGKIDC